MPVSSRKGRFFRRRGWSVEERMVRGGKDGA